MSKSRPSSSLHQVVIMMVIDAENETEALKIAKRECIRGDDDDHVLNIQYVVMDKIKKEVVVRAIVTAEFEKIQQ